MRLDERISICHLCPQRQRPCEGQCICTVSGKPFVGHAERDECPENRFADASLLGKVMHGVAGIAKAVMHIGRAGDAMIQGRREICAACPEATLVAGIVKRCAKCGCVIEAKILNADEKCPLDKW